MYIATLVLGKIVMWLSRLAGNNGAALPGYIIERINKRFLHQGLNRLEKGAVIITGTNGKTTTTKMIAETLEALGMRVLTNKSGSNFVRSIIAVMVDKSSIMGHLPYDVAILEQDEAYAAQLVKTYKPKSVVVLNVMRDQMDRFGEITATTRLLEKVTRAATEFVVLSGHDSQVSGLGVAKNTRLSFFDIDSSLSKDFPNDDEWHDIQDNQKNSKAPQKNVAKVTLMSIGDKQATYKIDGQLYKAELKATGTHNFLNAATAIATVLEILPDKPVADIVAKVASVEPAFGRGEELQIGNTHVRLQLVKNPGGFMQSLKLLKHSSYDTIAMVINDDYADGRDMSWLWDVDFKALGSMDSRIVTAGTRGLDMAVRLKYDEITTDQTITGNKIMAELLVDPAISKVIIFCTYTAMMRLRRELIKLGHVEHVR